MTNRFLFLLLLAASPAAASEAALYQRLSDLALLKDTYTVQRTPAGVDFLSREQIKLPSGETHAKYHIEIEGPMPARGLASIDQMAEAVASVVRQEVDATQAQENPIAPGVNVAFVGINGVVVAILDYKANNEGHPYRRRIVLPAGGTFYIATMSLHTAAKDDPAGMAQMMLVIDMVNSGEIEGLRAP